MEPQTASPTAPDITTRLALAQAPETESQALWQLIDDPNDLVANTARGRLRPVEIPMQGLGIGQQLGWLTGRAHNVSIQTLESPAASTARSRSG
jgi:hypothetical protein